MKKLLVLSFAMAGATTLLAVDAPVADFESYATGDMSVLTEENDLYFWDTTNPSQETGSIVEYSDDGVTAPTDDNYKYFHVDSGSDTVLRNSVSHMTQDSVAEYEDLGKYMDAYVQFTAADEPEDLTGNADKIRFYLLKTTDEQENETLTFHVCAGYLKDGSYNNVEATDYEVTFADITPAENTWYRLVIKTIANISTGAAEIPGFVIYLNGVPATSVEDKGADGTAIDSLTQLADHYNEAGALFPSMIQYSADNAQKLVGLGFRGTGNVDNIAFTTAAPADYADDPTLATPIELYIGESAEAVDCNNFDDVLGALTKASATTGTLVLGKSFDFGDEGYEFDDEGLTLTIDLNGNSLAGVVFTAGTYTIKDTAETAGTLSGITVDSTLTIGPGEIVVADAVTVTGTLNILSGKYAEKPSADGATLTLPAGKKFSDEKVDGYYVLVDEGGSVPTVDPVTGTAEFDTEAKANAATVAVPAAVASTGVTAEAYDAYFTKTVTAITEGADAGKWSVTATLNKAVVLPQDVGEDEAETEMLEGLVSIAIGEAEGVSITTKKGLYYWIDGTKELGGSYTAGTGVLGDGTSKELTKPELGDSDKAFYKVSVGVEAPAAE